MSAEYKIESKGPMVVTIPAISLRDWLAGMAMQGLMASTESIGLSYEELSNRCYQQADVMIAEREK